ncbi:unnamed protein product [Didymodactylos carnosus]|nr:unnamed protein product [Didymodactylos carnosus]CAF4222493.1 unnamed protein product [Didymodactylos carnosus]
MNVIMSSQINIECIKSLILKNLPPTNNHIYQFLSSYSLKLFTGLHSISLRHVRDNDLPFITDQLIDSLVSLSLQQLQSLEIVFCNGEKVTSENVTHVDDLPFITNQLIDSLLLSLSSKELESLENLLLNGEEASSSSKNVTHFIETIFSSSLLPSLTYFYLNNCINIKLNELFIPRSTTTNLQYLFCYHMSIEYLIHLVPALQKLKSIKIDYLCNDTDKDYLPLATTITTNIFLPNLIRLIVYFSDFIEFQDIQILFEKIPNLKYLIAASNRSLFANGEQWALLLSRFCPTLIKFRFTLRDRFNLQDPFRPSPDDLESTFKNTSGYWQQRIVEFKHDTVELLWSNTYGSFEFNVKACLPPAS